MSADHATWPGRADGLSRRESEVLVLCADGFSNREIADRLYLNVETVKSHLKRIFRQLGLYDRSETRLYLDTSADRESWRAAQEQSAGSRTEPDDLDERLALAGIGAAPHPLLERLADEAAAVAPGLLQVLYGRLSRHPATADFFTDETVVRRLVEHQQRYLGSLFSGSVDDDHVRWMVATGAVHHRIRVLPQWFLATHGLMVGDHLPLVFRTFPDRSDAFEATAALVRRVLFDAALVLDAYEVHHEREVLASVATRSAGPAAATPPPAGSARGPSPHRVLDVASGADDTSERLAFLEITSQTTEALARISTHVAAVIHPILTGFYDRAERSASLSVLLPPAIKHRLVDQLAQYWGELTVTDFGEAYATSRRRVGVIHERIGLSPQFYLSAIAYQLGEVLRSLGDHPTAGIAEADALIRTAVLDVTYVIDAYLSARVDALLEAGRFADQVVSGLETSVAIIDERDRISFANTHFLDLAGLEAAVVPRLPIGDALPIDGLVEFVDDVRRSGDHRTITAEFRGRHLRVAALPMRSPETNSRHLVAVVLDDLTDVVRAVERRARQDARFDTILTAVHAVLWEIDPDHLTVTAVSSSIEEITGRRDVDLVGRRDLIDLVDPADRTELVHQVRHLADGERHTLDVRIRHVELGHVRWMRTALTARTRTDGRLVVCGVSFDLDGRR